MEIDELSVYSGTPNRLSTQLQYFEPITLAEMQDVALLDRVETKFMLPRQLLLSMLSKLQPHYQILSVTGEQLSRYQTLYYDTPDFAFYLSHHAGILDRYKVRTREYVDSSLAFLEIKHKTNKNRTVKHRIPISQPMLMLDLADSQEESGFLQTNTPYAAQLLHPVLWNRYRRITLVGKDNPERITLDLDLAFFWQEQVRQIPQLVIAEVKQAGRSPADRQSPFLQQMRSLHLQENGFSKYCMGVTLLYPQMKANRFKKKQRHINKLLQTPVWM